jgi:hypothetical protein
MLVSSLAVFPTSVGADGESRKIDDYLSDYIHYRDFDEVLEDMRAVATNHSDIVAMYDLGELFPHDNGTTKLSWNGNHFWALKISDNPTINESHEPKILYVGIHHAREWMVPEVLMYQIETIMLQYGTNASITELVDTREMWYVPIMNPDGFIYSHDGARMWRKNRRDNGDGTFGVDPNRNYGYMWGIDDAGSSPNNNSETYRGPYPFSEPCTQIIRDLGTAINFTAAISWHSWQDTVTFPWSYVKQHCDEYLLLKHMARTMAFCNGYQYGDITDGLLYEVNGGFTDWFYANRSTYAFTIEVNSAADGRFNPPVSLILPTCEENLEVPLILARYADDYYRLFQSGIKARVVDPRGNPIEGAHVTAERLAGDIFEFTTNASGGFSYVAPWARSYRVIVEKEGYSSFNDTLWVDWEDRLTEFNITIRDIVPPIIDKVEASHEGSVGTSFGIGQEVRIDLFERFNESGLEGTVTIQSVPAQYFNRQRPLTWDVDTQSYYYLWNTTDLKPRSDYLVTTQLWDIDDNKDKDGVVMGQPDLKLELRDITPPMMPENLTVEVQPEGKRLLLRWNPNDDDTETYNLERSKATEGDWAFLINLTKEETEFMDFGLENDVKYFYRLRAWDKAPLPSLWSLVISAVPKDTVPPGVVEGLSTNAPSAGRHLELAWLESSDDTVEYVLYRDDGEGFEELAVVPRGTTFYTDTELVNDKLYLYRISAKDMSGNEGPVSISIQGTPKDTLAPEKPVVEPLPELTNQLEQTVRGTAEPSATVEVRSNQALVGTVPVGEDGAFEGVVTLIEGTNRVQFQVRDPSENPSGLTPEMLVRVDVNPPAVKSSIPVAGQQDVPVDVTVEISLTEAVVQSTLTVKLLDDDTGSVIDSSHTYDEQTRMINVFPTRELELGQKIIVVVDGSDPAGNALTGGAFNFTTVPPEAESSGVGMGLILALVLVIIIAVVGGLAYLKMRSKPELGEGGGEPSARSQFDIQKPIVIAEDEPSPEPMPEFQVGDDKWEEY